MVLILKQYKLVTIDVFYYMPDYRHVIQQFIWQTVDEVPDIPRTHRFLKFWKENICATIQNVVISKSEIDREFRTADAVYEN
jgi:uncharacterized protein Usg